MICAAACAVPAVRTWASGFFQNTAGTRGSVLCYPLAEKTHGEPGEVVISRRDTLATTGGEGDAPEFHFDPSLHVF